ncbi:MAG: flagellar basal body P-ring formation protein FlgA [Desulfobacteraceae bacterium]|nr:flagellar basal body P-ring formation protein FlgA [Desulfobacteraceae bacterium]
MFFYKRNKSFIYITILGVFIILYGALSILFAQGTPLPKQEIKIVIKETNHVNNPRIYLRDISEIHANGFLKEALEKIVLGTSPKPDKIKSFDKKKIISAIQSQRYLPENILVVSPQRIYVKRLCQKVSKQDIRKFVDRRLLTILKNKEYRLTTFNVSGLELYSQGNIQFVVNPKEIFDKNGKLSLLIDVIIDGIKEDRVSASGTIAIYENVLHSIQSIAKGEIISRGKFYLKKRNIFNLDNNYIKTVENIDGKALKTGVRKDDYLKLSLLIDPPLIRKGDIITLIAKNDNLLILTSGISKEDGFENGLIKVENINSGKLIRGIVKGKSKVEVVY